MLRHSLRWITLGLVILAVLVLWIPASAQGGIITATPMEDGGIVHVVQGGEALIAIAEAYGVSMDEIRALNGMEPDSVAIYTGDKLIIRLAPTPTITPSITPVPSRPTPTPTEIRPTRTPAPTRTLRPTLTPTATLNPVAETAAGLYQTLRQPLLIAMTAACAVGLVWTLWKGFRKGE